MPKAKKKLSKNAKTALKLLEESKLSSQIKNNNEPPQSVKPAGSTLKTSAANKPRPQKKRG
ncbi:MAG TPA: hypothetical protein VGC76_06980 [Pyrinomonadaceae bacterium]|jgi:hypothetical protein